MANTVGIKFLYNFAVGEYDYQNPGANVLSVTSEADGDHKKINLTTTPLRETWRSGPNISDFQEIIFETNDTTVTPDVFAVLNHNFTDLAIVQLQGSMTADFVTPAFTIQFQWTKKHLVLMQDVGLAYNYYRFRVLDPTNPCGYVEIGKIVAGESFTVSYNEDITDDLDIATDDLAYKMKTEGFFRAFNERVKVDKVSIRFAKLKTLAADNNTNYTEIMKMLDSVGETYPFFTIVDPDDPSFQLIWGVVDSLPRRGFNINRYVDMSFSIQEVY